jgi:ATP phosphoribosyltransferase
MIDLITSRIKGAITAKRYVMCQYNIERRHLPAATDITPGKRAATVTALNAPGWVAVSSMVERENTAVLLDKLAAIGAQDILVFEIRNTRQ